MSKMLERIVHEQVYAHLRHVNFLSECQSGFTKGHATMTCLIDSVDGIYNDIEWGIVGGVLFLDSVDHDILLNKLKTSNHTQVSKMNGLTFKQERVEYGVP